MVGYGSCAVGEVERRAKPAAMPWFVRMASVLVVSAIALLIVVAAQLGTPRSQRTALVSANKNAARMSLLCEGHFLDTATGIPEGTYSTLSHPGQLEGYKEPLPEDIRAQIDEKYYNGLGENYQWSGCLDDNKVHEVRTAVHEAQTEHWKLAHYASGHDETWWHPPVVKNK